MSIRPASAARPSAARPSARPTARPTARRRLLALAGAAATATSALAGTIAAITTATATAPTASAAVVVNARQIYAGNSFLNVAVAEGSMARGARIIQWTKTWGDEQKWYAPYQNETGRIQNAKSGLCITTDGVPGHWLFQDTCDGRATQQWYASPTYFWGFTGYTKFRNPATGLVMDVQGYSSSRGANIDGWYDKGSAWNNWNQWFAAI